MHYENIHLLNYSNILTHIRSNTLRTGVIFLCWLMFAFNAMADELRIAVASNFQQAAQELADQFSQKHGHTLVLLSGSTGKHYAQIRNGLPVDVLLAADSVRPKRLEEEGRAVMGTRQTYALGALVLWSADVEAVDSEGHVLRNLPAGTFLAIANPKLAPYGLAAQHVLQKMNLWAVYSDRIVMGENIGQAFHFVQSGAALLGLVARSQMMQVKPERAGSSWLVPQGLYEPIAQQAVILRDSPAARAWMAYLNSSEAHEIIERYGYDVP